MYFLYAYVDGAHFSILTLKLTLCTYYPLSACIFRKFVEKDVEKGLAESTPFQVQLLLFPATLLCGGGYFLQLCCSPSPYTGGMAMPIVADQQFITPRSALRYRPVLSPTPTQNTAALAQRRSK